MRGVVQALMAAGFAESIPPVCAPNHSQLIAW